MLEQLGAEVRRSGSVCSSSDAQHTLGVPSSMLGLTQVQAAHATPSLRMPSGIMYKYLPTMSRMPVTLAVHYKLISRADMTQLNRIF